ncbi:GNAT family N-acetyltransferase [Chryseobacterium sp. 6424]|uniref:GNAT family N-acetyltransferase n=1 Tax=Chryseobacterium sp. 6424 TaxID=2039166 RepID=UPI000EFD0C63|nr:GNAT family N-acetyltransferase [Chryseobacterium sp. 6424]AYO57845.1 GNAT family N-acetyltransferase [Chryseobacterium sp. 6424]
MSFPIPAILENEKLKLIQLQQDDFERLYKVASDPEIWAQHPNPDRYKRDVFGNFFKGAIESKGAYLVLDKKNNDVLGSTRFYDYDADDKSVLIGYTFYGRNSWGKKINPAVKKLMLDYAFQYVDKVIFHVGKENIRSQIAIERLGAIKTGEEEIAYFGETPKTNVIYTISAQQWTLSGT